MELNSAHHSHIVGINDVVVFFDVTLVHDYERTVWILPGQIRSQPHTTDGTHQMVANFGREFPGNLYR